MGKFDDRGLGGGLGQLVDLDRYPIHDLDGAAASRLIARCREALVATDCCVLSDFLSPSALARMADEAEALTSAAYHGGGVVNVYYGDADPSLPPDHPKNTFFDRPVGIVAYDQIPRRDALRRLYERDELTRFVAATVGIERLYPVNDPYQPLSIMVLSDGEGMGWHFDVSDFTVTLVLSAPEAGGAFEFVHNIRTDQDANHDALTNLFAGDRAGVHHIPPRPGTLVIFQGRNSVHHVTPVEGDRLRLMAVLTYDTVPDAVIPHEANVATYGPRVARR